MRFIMGALFICALTWGCRTPNPAAGVEADGGRDSQTGQAGVCGPPAPFRIVVLGDRTGRPDDNLFVKTIREASRLKPDLLLSVGDLIDGYQPDERLEEAEAEWDHVLGQVRSVFGDIPLYVTAGNHDVWSERSAELFEKKVGHPLNTSFEAGPVRFILLDSSRSKIESDVSAEDLDWLVRELHRARHYKYRVVVTHIPMWAIDGGGAYGSPLHDVLIAGEANWVFTGHWHHGMSDRRDDIEYRIVGPTGTTPHRPGHPESGNLIQYGFITVSPDGFEFSVVPGGAVLDSTAFPYELNQLEWKYQEQTVVVEGFELRGTRPGSRGPGSRGPGSRGPGSRGKATLIVNNLSGTQLREKLFLDGGEAGWRLYPAEIDIRLDPGQVGRYPVRYRIPAGDRLFPGPVAILDLPWRDKLSYRLKKELRPVRVQKLPRVAITPRVDGLFETILWERASSLGELQPTQETLLEGNPEVRVALAGETIWVGLRLDDSDMTGQFLGSGELADDYEKEDTIAMFVDINPSDVVYARVVVGASGRAVGDLFGLESSRGPSPIRLEKGETYAVVRELMGWQVEFALPKALLGRVPQVDDLRAHLGFNICVRRVRGGRAARACWQPSPEHGAPHFGRLDWVAGSGQSQTIRP